jgi:NADH-quinone oxidoreductase subunit L
LLTAVTLGTIRFTSLGLPESGGYSGILQSLEAAVRAGTLGSGAHVLTVIGLLLFVGAAGKSAQIPLYIWLPDAMEGPTPVSALIHAATMVTAGVYMVVRMNPVYQLAPFALDVIAVVGAVTAIFAASMALVQTDIKKVLAYSTISQLGYMFLALGVGAFAAGIFHLMTHAFFKALLFLGAGSVIHAMSGEQDIRKMGGLDKKIKYTYYTMLIATLAIAGIFPFAGFFSKDEILGRAFDRFFLLWVVGFITAGLTAFYMFRMLFLTFFGYCRADEHVEKHVHESPWPMTVPLMILAGFSIIGGWIGWPEVIGGENRFEKFLDPILKGVMPETGEVNIVHHAVFKELLLMGASLTIAAAGIFLAYQLYCAKRFAPELVAKKWPRLYQLLVHKYYVDEIYDALIVNRVKDLSTLFGLFDGKVIDGMGVDGAGWLARFGSTLSMWWDKWVIDGLLNFGAKFLQLLSYPIRLLQTGMFSSYAMVILIGLVVLLAYYGHHMQTLLRGVH